MPLLEQVRVEVYIPDPSIADYENLLRSFEAEFTLRSAEGAGYDSQGQALSGAKRVAPG